MTDKNSLVSVGLPTFNGAKVIRRAIDSLLGQSYKNIELIISDDASIDDTAIICQEYASRDSRVRYIRQWQNTGQLENFPFVLKEARGKYFMWASDDDWWDKSFIESLVRVLDEHKEFKVAMSSYRRVYDDGRNIDVLYAGDLSTNDQSYFSMFKKMMMFSPHHIFLYGIFHREFLASVFKRQRPSCIHWDRVVMVEIALVGRMYSLTPILFFKTQNSIPVHKRYKDKLSDAYMRPFAYTKFAFLMLMRPLGSGIAPLIRKFYVLPIGMLFLWVNRKRIFWDWVRAYRRLSKTA